MKRLLSCALILCVSIAALAAPRVEKLQPFSGEASAKLKAALSPDGYRVFLPNTLPACDIWLVGDLAPVSPKAGKDSASIYPFAESQFLGVIVFPKGGGSDFRGQPIRPGTYTMRYELLPNDGNHLGAAPNPDMVLLIPIADDPDPAINFDFGHLVELSAKAARTAHPAAFEMMAPDKLEPSVTQTDDGWIIFHSSINQEGKPLPISIVVKGSAAQ
jgi:hypothetical protein